MKRISACVLTLALLPPFCAAQAGAPPSPAPPNGQPEAAPGPAPSPVVEPAAIPAADPARPTVSTPATLTPVGYLQFESGVLGATHSREFSSQESMNEVVKLTVAPRLEFLAISQPFAHSSVAQSSSDLAGDVSLGIQGVIFPGEGAKPTVSLSYIHRAYGSDVPDLDIGSAKNSLVLLVSADVWGFHYDANALFNEQVQAPVRRAQFGQTLSISHHLAGDFSLSGEIWHFTQPFLQGNAIGTLWALGFTPRKNLVFDGGFDRGLTSTSTRWQGFAGFTYLLPHRLW
jgi:hypothetical protein